MKLCVGVAAHLPSVATILDALPEAPYEAYFSYGAHRFGSARSSVHQPSPGELEQVVDLLRSRGTVPNVVLNSACYGGEQFSRGFLADLRRWFNQIVGLGILTVTVADPHLVSTIRREWPDVRVVVSTVAEVRTDGMAEYYDELGVARIVLSPDLNRDLSAVRRICDSCDADVELLVNEGCIFKCPFRQSHHRYNAHRSRGQLRRDSRGEVFRYVDLCGEMCRVDPSMVTASPFVRPEDIALYESLGVEYFKVAGRNMPVDWIVNTAAAYQNRSYRGNLVELLNSKEFLRDEILIDNESLQVDFAP